jgi:hypothetical protein
MEPQPSPCFLDFEASSLSRESFPIEVAWSLEDGSIESYLISPEGIPTWSDWSRESEKIHGLTRNRLLAEGSPPLLVRLRLEEFLRGKVVYTDAPDFDGQWMTALFAATGDAVQRFELRDSEELFLSMLGTLTPDRPTALIELKAIKATARKNHPLRHRAAWDVEYLMEVWRLSAWRAGLRTRS